jgi:hypothetical protein
MTTAYKALGGRPEGNTSHVRPRSRREENIKMDYIREIGCNGADWIQLAQDASN